MEQRSFRRVNFNAEITVKAKDGVFHGILDNISMGGLFARVSEPMPVAAGDTAEIMIPLPGGSRNDSIVVNAMATRTNENGIAFRFLDIDPDALRALFSLIYHSNI